MDYEAIYTEMDKNVELYAKKINAKPITFVDKIKVDTISSVKQKLKKQLQILTT